MAVQTVQNLPAQFIQDLGQDLGKEIIRQAGVPVVATGIAGISQQPGEDAAAFKARQDAARAFTTRQQSLAGLAPQVAGLSQREQDARTLAQAGLGSFAPFVTAAQQQVGAAGTTLGGIGTGATAFQQDVGQFMSPFQQQVIDTTLAEFDRNQQIQEQKVRDQQAALGVLGSGRAGVQLAELGTGAARERALLQAGLLQQGFGQAAAARQQDIANRFGLSSAQANLGQFQTGLASLVPSLQRADIGQLGTLGAIDRSLDQARLDAQTEAARQAAFAPQQQLDRFAAQVTGLMGGYPGGTRQEFVPNPTPLQSALGIATTLGGLYLGSR